MKFVPQNNIFAASVWLEIIAGEKAIKNPIRLEQRKKELILQSELARKYKRN
ncbi:MULTISPECIES: hypothetical protein [Prolixibacter]|uniref:Uncharacterized protein n=1 Tax=Prolixibacter denitrificans TaxID=1541063 RepID=A0A2P8CKD7_9BACT|nr:MULTISPECIES: hypothetical protein [Prolixibacter]PSK85436.1 hypothetical protein CLV93_101392 [Prolixibacter denitrificans]GET20056.1 hypothetical protein JCM18694_03020 [Prolixibacter denitrificans]